MKAIQEDPGLELQNITTEMYLPPEFGLTYRQIEKDGFKIKIKKSYAISARASPFICEP